MAPDWEDSAQPLQNMLRNREPVFRSESWVCPIKLWNTVHSVNFMTKSVSGLMELLTKFEKWKKECFPVSDNSWNRNVHNSRLSIDGGTHRKCSRSSGSLTGFPVRTV